MDLLLVDPDEVVVVGDDFGVGIFSAGEVADRAEAEDGWGDDGKGRCGVGKRPFGLLLFLACNNRSVAG